MEKYYTLEEIKKHNKKTDCWIIIDDNVLDVTKFLEKHPAGVDIIVQNSGQDVTEYFDRVCHSNKAYEAAMKYKIGCIQK